MLTPLQVDSVIVSMDSLESTPVIPSSDAESLGGPSQRSIGRYQVQWVLGRGAEGCVYAAFDPDLARRVALKVYDHVTSRTEGRLIRASRLAGQLLHPNIVATYDFVRDGATWALVNEYLDGGDLDSIVPDDGTDRLRILRDVATGMAHAHNLGIAHLDLKFSNVFRCQNGAAKVLDFGLARDFSPLATLPLDDGALVGTPMYMAPEIYGGGSLNLASDVWSFGVLAFRLLTGRFPFTATTFMDLAHAVCHGDVPRLSKLGGPDFGVGELPHADARIVSTLVDASLERNARVRPSFTEVADALTAILHRIQSPVKPSEFKFEPQQ